MRLTLRSFRAGRTPCQDCPELARADSGIVCVRDQLYDAQQDEQECPDARDPSKCRCRNAFKYHGFVRVCKDMYGCDGGCAKKLPEQKLVKAEPIQALAVALHGPVQSTPRAESELYAILMAMVHGMSPQLIISDHVNHVHSVHDKYKGCYRALNPRTLNLDMWRLVARAIQVPGGLAPEGPKQLWIEWQPAHARAYTDETNEQKNRRRRNAVADFFANDGRKLHADISTKLTRADVARQWARGVGAATHLQYDRNFNGCDHDIRPQVHPSRSKGKKQVVEVPKEACILRKSPWGQRSVGTSEYRDDINHDDARDSGVSAAERQADTARAAARTMDGASYNERVNKQASSSTLLGQRIFTRTVPEASQRLAQEDAYGHKLYVVGLYPLQYVYCERCNAYTGTRAQNLFRKCTGMRYPSRPVNRLREGHHPDTGAMLATLPRRVTRRDAGYYVWNGNSSPEVTRSIWCENSDAVPVNENACNATAAVPLRSVVPLLSHVVECAQLASGEEDALGLGLCVG